jgi:hypothetical protein
MNIRKLAAPGLLAIAIAITGVAACSSEREASAPSQTKVADPTDVIDEQLMISLAQAKNFHRKAKVYMGDGNLAAATASVRQILSLRFPAGARAAQFDSEGEPSKPKATEERRAAIAAYDRSIQINEKLQKQLMEDR